MPMRALAHWIINRLTGQVNSGRDGREASNEGAILFRSRVPGERRAPALFLSGGFGGRKLFQFGNQRTRGRLGRAYRRREPNLQTVFMLG
jgi:hypothetical protein